MSLDRDTRPVSLRGVSDPFGALVVFGVAFLVRWVALDFDNDYFMHMAWAAEMLLGEWPVRDFVEPGFPLQTLLAYGALRLGGYQLLWEGVIACGLIAAGSSLTYLACRALGIPRALSGIVTLIGIVTFPRLYAYPKAFVYAAALYALLRYLHRPRTTALLLVSAATAVGFLFRHDHGAWIAGPVVLALILVHWRQPSVLARSVLVCTGAAALIVAPWLVWVLLSGHAGQYFDFLSGQSRGLTNRTRLPDRVFQIDSSSPLLSMAPIEYPVIGIRWAPAASDADRGRAESRYGLEPTGSAPDEYRILDLGSDNIRALLLDPLVEDTRGIDRGSHRTPSGIFPWLYLQMQRYLPPVRARLLPGLIARVNAEPWLTWVSFTVPWLVLGALTILVVGRGATSQREHADAVFVAASAVLSIVTYQTLVRASPDSRLGDIAAMTAMLLAWLTWRAWTLRGWMGAPARIAAVLLVTLTFGSALVYGRVVTRFGDAGVDGPANLVRRAGGQATLYGGHPLELYAPPGTRGLAGLARWLNQCTREGERVSVIGFEPQVFFLAQRGFAGGHAFYDLGWNSSDRDQQVTIERWSRQRVPVVLALSSEWESFSRDYPMIRAFIDTRYESVQRSTFGGGKELTVLANTSSVRVGTHADTGLPCFK